MGKTEWLGVCAAVVLLSCAPKGTPVLDIELGKRLTDRGPVVVRVVATKADGTIGSGPLTITAASGSLSVSVVELDAFGTGRVNWSCDPTTEPECAGSVRVAAEWTSEGISVNAEARLSAAEVGGAGGGAGGGGGAFSSWAGSVLLFGSLSESSRLGAIAPLSAPNESRVGFNRLTRTRALAVKPTGEFFYWSHTDGEPESSSKIFQFVEDQLPLLSVADWGYPGTPERNDIEIAKPPCGGANLLFRPDNGSTVWACGNGDFYENGAVLNVGGSPLATFYSALPGASGLMLRWDSGGLALRDAGGVETPVNVPLTLSLHPRRAVADGFLLIDYRSTSECSLYHLSLDGTLTARGAYGPLPTGVSVVNGNGCNRGVMTADGQFYVHGVSPTLDDVVLRRFADGSPSEVVYDETSLRAASGRPPVMFDGPGIESLILAP